MAGASKNTFEKFSSGEAIPVAVGAIEKELGAMWQAAGAQAESGEGAAVSRAAMWNLIVHAGAGNFLRTKDLVDQMAPHLPARVVVLRTEAPSSGGEIEATIETNVVSRPGGTRTVSSEEITLAAGDGGVDHFPALVRSLQVPGLPTALIWIDGPPNRARLTRQLLDMADRLVVDTAPLGEGDLCTVHQLSNLARAEVTDLSWLRLHNFRLLFAGMFEPPVGGAPLRDAHSIRVHHSPQRVSGAVLLVGWLGAQLGWTRAELKESRRGVRRFRFQVPRRDPIDVLLEPVAGEAGTSGMVGIELQVGDESYSVNRLPGRQLETRIPIAPPRAVKLDQRSDAELCVAALGPAGRDTLFGRALGIANDLCEMAAWAQ